MWMGSLVSRKHRDPTGCDNTYLHRRLPPEGPLGDRVSELLGSPGIGVGSLGSAGEGSFVGEDVVDGPEGEENEAESGFGAVKPVGPGQDEPNATSVKGFVADVSDPQFHGGEDPFPVFADGAGQGHERLQSAAGSA